jgi:hypothetical protein
VTLYCLIMGRPFSFDPSPRYLGSLAFLAVFGSVLAFGAYLTLVGRIGAGRAGYAMVAVPLVALALSTLFEGLRWQPALAVGVALCLGGNLLVLPRAGSARKARRIPVPAPAANGCRIRMGHPLAPGRIQQAPSQCAAIDAPLWARPDFRIRSRSGMTSKNNHPST